MSQATRSLYPAGSVNEKRLATDRLFIDEKASFEFRGILDDTARYIENFQLLDPTVWARFVEQYRVHSDIDDNGWRGEYWGKMMRGAAFTYSYTKNEALYRALTDTVEDMMASMDDLGRISTYTTEKEFGGWDIWCRKYVLLGMQYYMEICRDQKMIDRIIVSMCRQVDYLMDHFGPGKLNITETTNFWRGLASSSILEPVVRLYDLTNEQKYLDFAGYIVSIGGTSIANLFEIAYEDKTDPYQYPITKAYEMISNFEGLLEYYRATGEEKYRVAVVNFARRLAKTDITIIGTAGCTHELLDHAAARQTDTAYQGIMQETCVTVTWMKFCMQILLLTGDSAYADAFECSLYNAYLGAVNTEKVKDAFVLERYPNAILEALPFDSYSSLLPNTRGRGIGGLKLMPDNHYYGCCACIGAAGIGMMHKVAVMAREDGTAMNLYIPGSVTTRTPRGGKLTLHTDTAYPADGRITVSVMPEMPEVFALALRVPAWSEKTTLTINGEPAVVTPGTYAVISRQWRGGDTVVLTLDMRVKALRPVPNPRDIILTNTAWMHNYMVLRVVEESPDAKFHIALRRGPLVLARDARLDGPGSVDEPVDVAVDENDYADLTPCLNDKCPSIVAFKVKQNDGKPFTVIDYASAGKTWREDSRYACWLPTVK